MTAHLAVLIDRSFLTFERLQLRPAMSMAIR